MAEILWYYAQDHQQMGPVNSGELKRMAAAGQITADDLIWREGMEEWAPAGRVRGLFSQRDAGLPEAEPLPVAREQGYESDVRLATATAPPPAPLVHPSMAHALPAAPSTDPAVPPAPVPPAAPRGFPALLAGGAPSADPHDPLTPGLRKSCLPRRRSSGPCA